MALRMARIETIISASKVHRNTWPHGMPNLNRGLLEPISACIGVLQKPTTSRIHKNEEPRKTRAIQRSKQGEYPELHHVSTTKGHADCLQKQDATHRHNNKCANT